MSTGYGAIGAVVQCNGTVPWYSADSTVVTLQYLDIYIYFMYIPCILCLVKCMKAYKTRSFHIAVFTRFSMHMCDSDCVKNSEGRNAL